MLKGLDPLLGPDLLAILRAVGHGARWLSSMPIFMLRRARAREAFATIATGETRLYGNLLLRTGVIRPASAAAAA